MNAYVVIKHDQVYRWAMTIGYLFLLYPQLHPHLAGVKNLLLVLNQNFLVWQIL